LKGKIEYGSEITSVVDTREIFDGGTIKKGNMKIIVDGVLIKYVIINIPHSKIYFGVCL
jgi:hypothetical protein